MTTAAAREQQALRALYGGWIKRIALLLKARMPWADLDELLQWGAIGMMEAMKRFDPGHGVDFQAFATRRVRGAMINGLRREGALPARRDDVRRRGRGQRRPAGRHLAGRPARPAERADNRAVLVAALRTPAGARIPRAGPAFLRRN